MTDSVRKYRLKPLALAHGVAVSGLAAAQSLDAAVGEGEAKP